MSYRDNVAKELLYMHRAMIAEVLAARDDFVEFNDDKARQWALQAQGGVRAIELLADRLHINLEKEEHVELLMTRRP